ncbi:CaiB/BaiF CoA-transferase family protein [Pseudoduganella ginsengisoli]|uniref:CoA transferase n=1 Tax=Pseudoduganella ginsengisoli TaxID=1462440 RepID=A0A6L6Q813_9BURK|nr:CaiB/BaiF CoA-transferase family protein [Pseudoduganella ginsengisoli]MTW05322.1 CoA transferase [Pseudoduganella ginsengisoli]
MTTSPTLSIQPLAGVRIVEFEGIGPGPLCGAILAGMGAAITLVTRPQKGLADMLAGGAANPLREGKHEVQLDLKDPQQLRQALDIVAQADALIEGNRPGVMERLGLGPAHCAAVNPRIVYGRMTGWGQDGPLAQAAGHDINYVALTGMLSLGWRDGERPVPVPTMMGDAPGALGLAFGMVSAILHARTTGKGSVVDGAIVDTVAMLGGIAQLVMAGGQLGGPAPSPFHDSPFYDSYRCADGRWITIGALEPQFYALLLQKLGLHDVDPKRQYDTAAWPALKARFAALFLSQPCSHWCELMEGTDVCFAPVLTVAEARRHPHNAARGIFNADGSARAAPRVTALPEASDGR